MDAATLDIAIKVVGLTSAIIAGGYATVRTVLFGFVWWHRRQKKEDGWSAQDKRIGEVTDRFTGVLNELQNAITNATKEQERKARERDIAIHQRLDEHVGSDNKQFGQVLQQLGNIQGAVNVLIERPQP